MSRIGTLENTTFSVIFYYLLVISNYTDTLLSKDLQNFIKNNRNVKHLAGLLLLTMSINQQSNKSLSVLLSILTGIVCYIYFLFSTKMNLVLNLILIFVMICFYYTEKYIRYREKHRQHFLIKYNKSIRIIFIILITGIIIYGNVNYFITYYNNNKNIEGLDELIFNYMLKSH